MAWSSVWAHPGSTPRRLDTSVLRNVCYRLRADPAVAVLAGAAVRLVQRELHHVGGNERGIQADRPRRSGPALGRAQVQTQHEL